VLCAFLMQESSGGRNIYGHDPTIFQDHGEVTETNYADYVVLRDQTGLAQGVGPMQLCVAPETRVLTADLRWLPAEKVTAGMEIIAFDEEGTWDEYHPIAKRRYFRTALVEDMKIDVMDRIRVRTDQREIIVTPNHKFLTWRPERYTWRAAAKLQPGDTLPSIPVWDEQDSYIAGYLAGQFDGEGCFTVGRLANGKAYSRVLWSQTADSPDVPFVQSALTGLGFKHGWHKAPPRGGWSGDHPGRGKPVAAITIGGGWPEQMSFLGSIRPRRMLRNPRLRHMWEQKQLNSCAKESVLSVESLAPGSMVAHQTSSKTLITEGLLSHNTWPPLQDRADAAGGCWRAGVNTLTGARILAEYRAGVDSWVQVARLYKGEPGADVYAAQMKARFAEWRTIFITA
jgi:hypothetical protein